MSLRVSRRSFLKSTSVLGAASLAGGVWSERAAAESKSPNEKLNLAFLGVHNRALENLNALTGENVFALCDVDESFLTKQAARFPATKTYHDFRKMLDAEKTLDGVVIGTPDHVHAPATLAALKLGKHVYCEKPLTHTVAEARLVAEAAAKAKVATQMGTQIHAGENYRRVVEIIQSGAIGPVKEVHTWVGAAYTGNGRPKETPEVPQGLHWDLWLGPAPERPYNPAYHPFKWRSFWDFGGAALADMACHHMDLPFWALGLKDPLTIEAEGPEPNAETGPAGLKVKYEYAARKDQPALTLTWYDGNKIPKELSGIKVPGGGNFFIGEKGMLQADYGNFKLYPEEKFKDYKLPAPTIPRSIGHHAEWVKACKEGTPTTCNFAYASRLTEAVLLGNVSHRTGNKKLEWDAEKLQVKNLPEAAAFVNKKYRKGWELS